MAASDVSVQENWTIETELTEAPPRRLVPSGYPDLNKPNSLLFQGIGGALMIAGIFLLTYGASRGLTLWTLTGIAIAILGMVVAVVIVPALNTRHISRAKHLIQNGIPVMARVLSADNTGGDNSPGRLVKFQVTTPGGELTHKTTHADDSLLPRKIPGNTTALLDIQTGDVELYCALPFRAIPKMTGSTAPASAVGSRPIAGTLPSGGLGVPALEPAPAPTGAMGTLNMGSLPQRPVPQRAEPAPPPPPKPAPKQEQTAEEKQERTATPASLPWE